MAREVVSFQVSSVAGLREALCVAQQNSKLALIEACMDKKRCAHFVKKNWGRYLGHRFKLRKF
ncbi:hypothetical protein HBZS_124380 [Helicobacter bizzozeronii CCUG 35545]|nr:hypothetical protein HBZS_124380 [Helicobacter bizzozeronii CCUG 35545]